MRPSAERQIVVVTGAGGGIGAAIALGLARSGYEVVGVGRSPAPLAELQATAAADGLALTTQVVDSTDEAATVALFNELGTTGRLLGAVFAAGFTKRLSVLATTTADLDELLATNLAGTFIGVRECGRVLKEAGHGGAMVIISSINAQWPLPSQAAYSTTKAALDALVVSAAVELGPDGIRVNNVAPGAILTKMNAGMGPDAPLRDRIPLKRIGVPEDVVGAVEFLLGPQAAYVTGATITVDGGMRHFR